MIKLLVTAISITTKDYGVDRTSAKAVSPTLCYWHKKFHENVIECKNVGDQITIDRLSPNLHDLISIHSIPSQCKSQRISAIHATYV